MKFHISEVEGLYNLCSENLAIAVFGTSTYHSKEVLLMWFPVLLVLVSVSVLFSPSMCRVGKMPASMSKVHATGVSWHFPV